MAGEIKLKQNKDVCKSTIENYLFAENLKSYVAARKPLLKQEHKDKRKVASENWLKWPLKKIKTLIFCEESIFDLYNGDGKVKVWRLPSTRYNSENIVITVKYDGGTVIFWAV
ncbi:hypothetical protein ENBRE01_3073 [Enteropsectra breve]|nr:hypothetical protein ENBRE01_3073 [Enteropsectra breve]